MKSLLRRHRIAVALFAFCLVFLIGGSLSIRALSHPETQVFPADGRLALDYISGNRAYSVWHTKKEPVVVKVTMPSDGSEIKNVLDHAGYVTPSSGPYLAGRYDLRREGAYEFRLTGLAPGDTATLVRENDFIWVMPAMLSGVLAFLCFIGGVFAVFVVKRRLDAPSLS